MGKRAREEVDEEEEFAGEVPEFEDPCLDNDDGEPSAHSVSVGGLSFDTKRKVLKKIFKAFGTVVTVRRYVPGAPRRADVSYSSADEMKAAIEGMNGKDIEGRTVKVITTPVVEVAVEVSKKKGKGKGKGKFGKGKGKGKDEEDGEKKEGEEGEKKEGDEEVARDSRFSPIASAQREARLRFEKDILDRMQGRWGDEADPNITYVVEGSICSVSSGDGGRGFRNRLSVYGVEFCWDARRFWHYLNLPELYSQGEIAEKLEWNPAKDSPPTTQIVWNRLPPLSEVEEEAKEGEGEGEKKEEKAEEKEAEEKPAEAAPAEAAPEASA
mmetsp:Transcript_95014/g.268491  ORF Transcript_95014/g.268491 Transcript_95014/m.268491 type:complete len:325 (-) Transcript_95014:556-1530(-)